MDFKFTGMDGDGDKLSSPCSSLFYTLTLGVLVLVRVLLFFTRQRSQTAQNVGTCISFSQLGFSRNNEKT